MMGVSMTLNKTKLFAAAIAMTVNASILAQPSFAEGPKLIKAVPPEYPRSAMRRNIEGVVVLGLNIDDGGNVLEAQVLEAEKPGIFDKSAILAAKKWKYAPGEPAENHRAEINFRLTE